MGKSTTAQMFRDAGIPVYDADATVHQLYSGKAAPLIEAEFPGTVFNGTVDRAKLSEHVIGNSENMERLESIVHPMVLEMRNDFLKTAEKSGAFLVVIDNPLLFEMGGDKLVEKIIVVTAPAHVQRERVLSRPGMTEEKFEAILKRQLPDAEKRVRADLLIDTSLGMENARNKVREFIESIRQNPV